MILFFLAKEKNARAASARKEMYMEQNIVLLQPTDFDRCGEIWNLKKQPALAKRFRDALQNGSRETWVYQKNGAWLGEISLVYTMPDDDYTIPGRRAYVSHLVVAKKYRRQGIGKALVEHVVRQAQEKGLQELSIGVDLDNFPALRLYTQAGFDRVLCVCEDDDGQYVKLMRMLESS